MIQKILVPLDGSKLISIGIWFCSLHSFLRQSWQVEKVQNSKLGFTRRFMKQLLLVAWKHQI